MTECVKWEMEAGIAVISISRPEKRNAFNQAVREGLHTLINRAARDEECRGVLIKGEGSNFSVGGDVDAFTTMHSADLPALLATAHGCVRAIRQSPKPFVAAVKGFCSGGAVGLVLACDAVVAARDASFAFPFLKLGLVPDWGCAYFLKEKAGQGIARRLLLQAAVISGEKAQELGVVDELAQPGSARDQAWQLLQAYLSFPGDAWGKTKQMLNGLDDALEALLSAEASHQQECFESPAFKRAVSEFLNKRQSRK